MINCRRCWTKFVSLLWMMIITSGIYGFLYRAMPRSRVMLMTYESSSFPFKQIIDNALGLFLVSRSSSDGDSLNKLIIFETNGLHFECWSFNRRLNPIDVKNDDLKIKMCVDGYLPNFLFFKASMIEITAIFCNYRKKFHTSNPCEKYFKWLWHLIRECCVKLKRLSK